MVSNAGGGTATTSSSTSAAKTSSGGVVSTSTNTTHPPAADITVKTCTLSYGMATATGVIVNHTSKASDYDVHIGFMKNGVRVDDGYDMQNDVQPGQTVNFQAGGTNQVSGALTCTLIGVDRTSAVG